MRILKILAFLIITNISAQENSKEAGEFLDIMKSEKIIDEHYAKYKNKILNSTALLFNDYDLDIKDSTLLKSYNDSVDKLFKAYADEAKDRVFYIYSKYDFERLEKFIKLAKEEPDFNKVLLETNYSKIIDEITKEHSEYIVHDILITVRELKAMSQPLKLRLLIDRDTITNISKLDFNLELITNNAQYKKIQILNKNTLEISIPEDLDYNDIEHVIITYNKNEYTFFENHYERLPKELRAILTEKDKELHNPLSKYCFEKLLFWEIEIDHDPEKNPDYDLLKSKNEYPKGVISFKTRIKSIGGLD